jgi:hypothetical protein
VLLLHGFPDSWRLWRHQLPALAKAGHRVIAPDLRGFGKTDRPAEVVDYKLRALVNDVVWYRANNDPATFVINDPTRISVPPVACPTLGVWSSDDFALTETQMTGSGGSSAGPGATSGWTAWTTGCPCTPPNASMSCSSISSASLSARPGAVGATAVVA